jgi:predicted NBD/HSP70 family sugar kinase
LSVARPETAGDSSAVTETLACLEVGASSCETAVLDDDGVLRHTEGVAVPEGAALLVASPGLIVGRRVAAASNLNWYDVDPAEALGVDATVELLCNDAEAAALGESVLRDGADLVFVGLGTGVGGAVVRDGTATGNLLGHSGEFGGNRCVCGGSGCLETVAAGWALPASLNSDDLSTIAVAVAAAVSAEPLTNQAVIVVAGGIAKAYPEIVGLVALHLPGRDVEPSRAPDGVKSAAAWGLIHAYRHQAPGSK